MKKVSQTTWKRYKESSEGKKVIALFEKLYSKDCSIKEMFDVAQRFDPEFFNNFGEKEIKVCLRTLDFFDQEISGLLSGEEVELKKDDDYRAVYSHLLHSLTSDNPNEKFDKIPQSGFKKILGANMFISLILYAYFPDYYIPNFFLMQFAYLQRFAEKYELELPEIPNRSDYRERCLYYRDMNDILISFSIENGINKPAEICAFIYGCEMPVIKDELEAEFDEPMPSVPEQAWILVGNYDDGEKDMKHGYWQANQLTLKGDILLFYEKSPVKKLNAVYTALSDGVVDPFFHYYSNTYIGNKIVIPDDKAITFDEFKNSEYFKNRSKEGNFVSKNFQDVSGWAVTSEDYAEIKRMLEAKGFDTSVLPKLYEPKVKANITITSEKDVEELLLKPLLEQMGWKKDVDYFQQLQFPAGHGTTKRPDFCLHMTGDGRKLGANVVIEVKDHMKTAKEIGETFEQGLTYAKWGGAKVLVLCDREQIRVYERTKDGKFDDKKFRRFRWEEMKILEKYLELKRMLDV
jgi:hypothetical protein